MKLQMTSDTVDIHSASLQVYRRSQSSKALRLSLLPRHTFIYGGDGAY